MVGSVCVFFLSGSGHGLALLQEILAEAPEHGEHEPLEAVGQDLGFEAAPKQAHGALLGQDLLRVTSHNFMSPIRSKIGSMNPIGEVGCERGPKQTHGALLGQDLLRVTSHSIVSCFRSRCPQLTDLVRCGGGCIV